MISPAKDFREDKKRSAGWQSVVDSERFRDAASTAFAEMEIEQPAAKDMQEAAARAWLLQGAKRYLTILMGLTQPPAEQPKKVPVGQLIRTP